MGCEAVICRHADGRRLGRFLSSGTRTEDFGLELVPESQCLQLGNGIVLGPEVHGRTRDTERLGERGHAAKGSYGLLAGDLGIVGHGVMLSTLSSHVK